MSTGNHRSGHPALQAAARLPAYIVLSLLIVAVTAGGLLAARGPRAEEEGVPPAAADTDESQLPTPVPVESATPLPTPVPLGQTVIVDTAVAFWVDFIPDELAYEYRDAILAAGGIPSLRPAAAGGGSGPAQSSASPPATPEALAPGTPVPTPAPAIPVVPSLDGGVVVTTPAPLPEAPLPSDSVPLPPLPLPLPTPTLPQLLP